MRGRENRQEGFFSYVSPEQLVPQDHPLRPIRKMVHEALANLSPLFSKVYSTTGRPSITPERLLMEQLDYNILFRWFVGLSMDDQVWEHSVFSKNCERVLGSEVTAQFFALIRQQAHEAGLLSDEHFTVDGTLIEAWASLKSFRPHDAEQPSATRNPKIDFHGQQRTNQTHTSSTDPQARLYRKSKGAEAKLCYMGHTLMENRNGMAVGAQLAIASGTAEPQAALDMIGTLPGSHRITVGAEKYYDQQGFVEDVRACKATAHDYRHFVPHFIINHG